MAAGNKKESKKGEENMTRGQESEAGEPRKIAAAMVVGEGGKGGGGPGRPRSFCWYFRHVAAATGVSTPAVGPASRWRGVVGVAFSRVFGPGGGTVGGCQLPSCGICICCFFHLVFFLPGWTHGRCRKASFRILFFGPCGVHDGNRSVLELVHRSELCLFYKIFFLFSSVFINCSHKNIVILYKELKSLCLNQS
jgi:hypothetical protein